MKTRKIARNSLLGILCLGTLVGGTGCSAVKNTWNGMNQTGQGATAGGAAGAAVGAGIGALIDGGKGTWIGALVGAALGAGTGALVGNQMDKQKKELEKQLAQVQAQEQANAEAIKVMTVKDSNNLDAIKVVMGDAVLFPTGSYTLSADAQAVLSRVAYNLEQFPNTDVTVVGYTDNTGTEAVNQKLSLERAQSVEDFLETKGIAANRLKAVGDGWNNPIASNATAAGRAQNRRVEIFITADKDMISQAESQAQ
ncbi:MAG: OmpA family protein [Muribaculaceae bacterium]|nr:OmpA family protein [Muribaculaceae bacterium]